MTAQELLQLQMDDAGNQLSKVFEGIEPVLDAKLGAETFSPRELAAHLGECYRAVLTETSGGKHQWGSYQPSTMEWPALWNEVMELRKEAVVAAIGAEGWEANASGFIPAHDYYHVGQMASLRLVKDPSWDADSLYS